ncbi:MAG TPA: NADH-ubiquinone oxidoreductase-F iron-sulfur binding region domain-containing protein [Streptosporangiaceae bacterium]|nr:NADH-ubiquinone oxidoreductase-F iron-sulfur binding region domain-containing protein [Streptosporangiaceae bacterium]
MTARGTLLAAAQPACPGRSITPPARGSGAGSGLGRPTGPAGLPRLTSAGGRPTDLADHLARHGRPAYRGRPGALIGEIAASGLTGRGGAAFPVHRKLAAVQRAQGRPVVVANAAEGEPASRKDEFLLWRSPHLVLDGLQLAAEAVGATSAVLYAGRRGTLHDHLARALAERASAGADLIGTDLVLAPEEFLAGEESALADRLSGGSGLPGFKQVPVFRRGVGGRPTLVQNAETLAHLALIARYGAGWFAALGTPDEPGTMLCTVHAADGGVHVTEAALGTPLRALTGTGPDVQAVLCGGYHGAWLNGQDAARLRLANADLRPAGAFTGAGVLAALPAGRCGLAETARVARYLALESAGQCGPCFNGLPRIAAALGELAGPRPDRAVLADLTRWSGLVAGRGACKHPDGTVRFVASALSVFAAEADAHLRGRCTAATAEPFLPLPGQPGRRPTSRELR